MLDILRSFTPITRDTLPTLERHYEGFAATRRHPRYFMSSLWLGAKSEFICGVVDGCLCMVKRRAMYHSAVIYLILPPMSLDGDLRAERRVLRAFYKAGIGAKLSDEDVLLYDLRSRVVGDPGNVEYIYRAGDGVDLAGGHNKNRRRAWADIQKFDITFYTLSMAPVRQTCRDIDKAWEEGKRTRGATGSLGTSFAPKIVAAMAEHARGTACLGYVISHEGRALVYAITQAVRPGWVALLVGRHTFDPAIRDIPLAQHLIECRWWADTMGADTQLNMGATLGHAGLDAVKERLRPSKRLEILHLPGARKLTLEDYHRSKPGTRAGFFSKD